MKWFHHALTTKTLRHVERERDTGRVQSHKRRLCVTKTAGRGDAFRNYLRMRLRQKLDCNRKVVCS